MAKAKKVTNSKRLKKVSAKQADAASAHKSTRKGKSIWIALKKEITWQDVISLILVLLGFAVFYSLYLDDKKDKERAEAIQACIQTCNSWRNSQDDMCIVKCNQDPKFDVEKKTEFYF